MEEITENQIEMAAKNLLKTFNDIRKECNIKPVHSGPIYLAEASELCSIGLNSSSVAEILAMQREKDKHDNISSLDAIFDKVIILAVILAIPTGIYILVNAL